MVTQRFSKGYRLNRISGYRELLVRHNRATDSQVLPVLECTSFKSSTDNRFTSTGNYWFQSVAGSGVYHFQIQCWQQIHLLQRLTGSGVLLVPEYCRFRSAPFSNPVLTTDSPATENYRFRSVAGYKDLMVTSWLDRKFLQKNSFNQWATEPTDWVPAYTTFSDSCFKELEILMK